MGCLFGIVYVCILNVSNVLLMSSVTAIVPLADCFY